MDTVLKMLLIAFVSLLAFSSGVYFGKQLSDSDYQLKALESDFNTKETKQAANDSKDDPEEAIAEEEVAALSDKWVSSEKDEVAHEAHGADSRSVASHGEGHEDHANHAAAPKHDTHAAHKAPAAAAAPKHVAKGAKPDLNAAHKAATRIASNASPVETQKPAAKSRVPTSLPKTVGTSADVVFTVQVASYPTPEAAKEHANQLVKKGFPAFPVEASVNGKTWYRVSVGSFKTQKDATTYRAQLLKQTELPSAIVQKIQR